MTPVPGNALSYQISLPSSDVWSKNDSRPPFDYLFSYHDAYVGVIAEELAKHRHNLPAVIMTPTWG
jgi:hypothetical protein